MSSSSPLIVLSNKFVLFHGIIAKIYALKLFYFVQIENGARNICFLEHGIGLFVVRLNDKLCLLCVLKLDSGSSSVFWLLKLFDDCFKLLATSLHFLFSKYAASTQVGTLVRLWLFGDLFWLQVVIVWWYYFDCTCILWYILVIVHGGELFVIVFLGIWWFPLTGSSLFVYFMMANERDDSLQSINVRLNGKNYSY